MKPIFRKLILNLSTILLLFLIFSPQNSFAETGADLLKTGLKTSADTAKLDTGTTDIASMMGKAVNYIFGVVGVIFLTIILVGGYIWMTAGGNEEKVKKAKDFILNGINGMIVIFIAYALVYTILGALSAAAITK